MSTRVQRQLGALYCQREPPAITLPTFDLPDVDEIEAKEVAARFAECRVIREGLDSWQEITQANSFESWLKIGRALLVGKRRALHITGANAAWGQRYSREFGLFRSLKRSNATIRISLS